MSEQLTIFNYSDYSLEDQVFLKEAAVEIQAREKNIWENVIAQGRKLTEVKNRLPHGAFAPWVAKECPWGDRTAQKYMKVSEELGANANPGSHLNGIAMKALVAIASASAKLESPEDKQKFIKDVGDANLTKLEFVGKPMVASEVKKLEAELAQARQDIGQLKTNAQMGESAYQLEVANRKKVEALLAAQKETENERIAAAKAIALDDAKKELGKEIATAEQNLKVAQRDLKALKENPSPAMKAAIAELEQQKRMLTNEIAQKRQRDLELEQQLKARVDQVSEVERLELLADAFKEAVLALFEGYSELGIVNPRFLSEAAIANIEEGLEGFASLKMHLERNISGEQKSKIVHIRPVEAIDVEALCAYEPR